MGWDVSWPVPRSHEVLPPYRGLRACWQLQNPHGTVPPLLDLMSAEVGWLLAFLQARAIAAGSQTALSIFSRLEAELAQSVGMPRVLWLPAFDHAAPQVKPRMLALRQLRPDQRQLLTSSLEGLDAPTRESLALLLERAFDTQGQGLGAEHRVRAIASGLPEPVRRRWLGNQAERAEQTFVPVEVAAARRLVDTAFTPGLGSEGEEAVAPRVRTVDASAHPHIDAATGLDLLMSTMVVRSCLRAGGHLLELSPVCDGAEAANNTPVPLLDHG